MTRVLSIIAKRLECFDPQELSQSSIIEWIKSGINIENEVYGAKDGGKSSLRLVKSGAKHILLFGAHEAGRPPRS